MALPERDKGRANDPLKSFKRSMADSLALSVDPDPGVDAGVDSVDDPDGVGGVGGVGTSGAVLASPFSSPGVDAALPGTLHT